MEKFNFCKFSLLVLLLLIVTIEICTNAQSGENNDTSEASGSGMRELPTPPSCHVPAHSDLNRGRMNLTEEEREDLMMEGRCYLACTNLMERFDQTKVIPAKSINSSSWYNFL